MESKKFTSSFLHRFTAAALAGIALGFTQPGTLASGLLTGTHRGESSAAVGFIRLGVCLLALAVVFALVCNSQVAARSWRRRCLDRTQIVVVAMFFQFATSLWWVTQFNAAAWLVLSAGVALIISVPFVFARMTATLRGALGFAALLAVGEALRERIPFGGFPIGNFNTALVDSPIAFVARGFGQLGIVFAASMIAAVAYVLLATLRNIRHTLSTTHDATKGVNGAVVIGLLAPLCVAALPFVTSIAFASTHPASTKHINVAVVQGGGSQGTGDENMNSVEVFSRHISQAANSIPATAIPTTTAQLVVFPEDVALSTQGVESSTQARTLAQFAATRRAWVIAGFVQRLDNDRFHNYAALWSPEGKLVALYEKHKRVPFGEYVPGRSFISCFVSLNQVPSDAFVGTTKPVFDTELGRFGVAISYESLFDHYVAQGIKQGATAVVVPTNASSFKRASVTEAEVAFARFRAIETDRSVVLGAPTGRSAIITPSGRLQTSSSQGEATTLRATIANNESITPYVRLGDLPMICVCVLIALVIRVWPCNLNATCRTPPLP